MGIVQKFKNAFAIIERLEERINICQDNLKLYEKYNLHSDVEKEKEALATLMYIKTGDKELVHDYDKQ